MRKHTSKPDNSFYSLFRVFLEMLEDYPPIDLMTRGDVYSRVQELYRRGFNKRIAVRKAINEARASGVIRGVV